MQPKRDSLLVSVLGDVGANEAPEELPVVRNLEVDELVDDDVRPEGRRLAEKSGVEGESPVDEQLAHLRFIGRRWISLGYAPSLSGPRADGRGHCRDATQPLGSSGTIAS